MDRIEAAKDFYESELSNPYSKQRDTAAFHLLGLELDSREARYDGNSGAIGNYTEPVMTPEQASRLALALRDLLTKDDPFEDA